MNDKEFGDVLSFGYEFVDWTAGSLPFVLLLGALSGAFIGPEGIGAFGAIVAIAILPLTFRGHALLRTHRVELMRDRLVVRGFFTRQSDVAPREITGIRVSKRAIRHLFHKSVYIEVLLRDRRELGGSIRFLPSAPRAEEVEAQLRDWWERNRLA